MRFVVAVILAVSAGSAEAGNPEKDFLAKLQKEVHVGNGGDVVVCYDGGGTEPTSVELLDLYEARTALGIVTDLGPADLSVDAKIELALGRLARVDAGRAARYREWAASFEGEARFTEDWLSDVPDSQHVSLPRNRNCKIEQIVVHREPTFPEEKRYTVDVVLWSWLEDHQRHDDLAALVLHELLYREGVGFGLTHSIGVRYMNAKLASAGFGALSAETYVDYLRRVGFGSVHQRGVWLDIAHSMPEYFSGGEAVRRGAVLADSGPYDFEGQAIWLACAISFFPDGTLQGFSFEAPQSLLLRAHGRPWEVRARNTLSDGQQCFTGYNYFVWYEGPGYLRSFESYGIEYLPTTQRYDVRLTGRIVIEETGVIASGEATLVGNGWVRIGATNCPLYFGRVMLEAAQLYLATVSRCPVSVGRSTFVLRGDIMLDTDSGSLVRATLPSDQYLWIGAKLVKIRGEGDDFSGQVSLYPRSGELQSANLGENVELESADGTRKTFLAGDFLRLDPQGRVTNP